MFDILPNELNEHIFILNCSIENAKYVKKLHNNEINKHVSNNNYILIYVQRYINLRSLSIEMIKYLHSKCNFTRNELIDVTNWIFSRMCIEGNIYVANWLHSLCEFSKDEMNINNMFAYVCINGYINVAKWLYTLCNFSKDEIMLYRSYMFTQTQNKERNNVAMWLESIFEKLHN